MIQQDSSILYGLLHLHITGHVHPFRPLMLKSIQILSPDDFASFKVLQWKSCTFFLFSHIYCMSHSFQLDHLKNLTTLANPMNFVVWGITLLLPIWENLELNTGQQTFFIASTVPQYLTLNAKYKLPIKYAVTLHSNMLTNSPFINIKCYLTQRNISKCNYTKNRQEIAQYAKWRYYYVIFSVPLPFTILKSNTFNLCCLLSVKTMFWMNRNDVILFLYLT